MSWVVKCLADGEYLTLVPGARWSKDRRRAFRFEKLDHAQYEASHLDASYQPRVIRLVPKRKPQRLCVMSMGAICCGGCTCQADEREAIAAWLERTFTMGILGTDTARRIRAGEHRR